MRMACICGSCVLRRTIQLTRDELSLPAEHLREVRMTLESWPHEQGFQGRWVERAFKVPRVRSASAKFRRLAAVHCSEPDWEQSHACALSIIASQIPLDLRMSSTASRTAPCPPRALVV